MLLNGVKMKKPIFTLNVVNPRFACGTSLKDIISQEIIFLSNFLGRIVLPIELSRAYEIHIGDPLEKDLSRPEFKKTKNIGCLTYYNN
jgi:hypothetical protein